MMTIAMSLLLGLSDGAAGAKKEADAIDVQPSASERLAACEKVYREARTYQDTGTVTQVYEGRPDTFNSVMPFTTAFERGGCFRWEFSHGMITDPNDLHRYTVWSWDGREFESYWTLNNWRMPRQSLSHAMAGPAAISGGSATAVVPLLRIEDDPNREIISTNMVDPIDSGTETVDGVKCWKIEARAEFRDQTRVLWIGDDGLIRKIYLVTVVDPAKLPEEAMKGRERGPKFTVWTTIEIEPVVNVPAIPGEAFTAPGDAPNCEASSTDSK